MGLVPALNEPTTGDPRVPGPLVENDEAIRDVVNGNIDADNLAANAVTTAKILDLNVTTAKIAEGNVTDAKLASPNNSAYRTLLVSAGLASEALPAGTYPLAPPPMGTAAGTDQSLIPSGTARATTIGPTSSMADTTLTPLIYFDDADYTVGSLTQKLRLRAQVSTNATAWSSVTATFGLYPVTFAGAANTLTVTLGTVVSGSTVAIANPSASSVNQGNSGDFTIPSDGQYCIGVVTSATLTGNAAALLTAQLQTRSTA